MSAWVGQTEYNQARSNCGTDCPNCGGEGRWWNSVDEDYFRCPGKDDPRIAEAMRAAEAASR